MVDENGVRQAWDYGWSIQLWYKTTMRLLYKNIVKMHAFRINMAVGLRIEYNIVLIPKTIFRLDCDNCFYYKKRTRGHIFI